MEAGDTDVLYEVLFSFVDLQYRADENHGDFIEYKVFGLMSMGHGRLALLGGYVPWCFVCALYDVRACLTFDFSRGERRGEDR
jgi:hypothetical protein